MSGPSAASEAFRKCSADLIKVIPDQGLLVLAWELYSAGVVSKPAVEGLSPMEKKTKLLSALGDQIDVEPSKFQNLLQALRKQPPLKEMADKLETTYKECVPQMSELTEQTPPSPPGGAEKQMSPSPPPSTISDHPSSPPPSLEPAVRVASSPPYQEHSAGATHMSRAAVFARENRYAITAKFADFQTKVCKKLFSNGVDIEQFRLFVANQFPPGDCIPPPPASLTEIFEAITHHGLWDYFHYSPLVRIAKKFGAGDHEIEEWVQTYKKDLKAYQIVATVEDSIETDLDTTDPPPEKRAKYDPRYYTPVKWKTNFVDQSLQHLADVWEMFSSHYLLPDSPPTATIDRVHRGCFSVTWLVPSRLIPSLIKRAKIDTDFFQKHHILKVTVGDNCVYEQVTEKNTSEPEQNVPSFQVQLPRVTDWKDTFGGYDCKFVTPPTSVLQTECPICRLILRDPYQAKCCGTDFCHSCIQHLPTDNNRCPNCRKDKFEVFEDKRLKQSLSQLQVWCTHNKDGCRWSGQLGDLEHHLKTGVHSAAQCFPNIPDISEVDSTIRCDSNFEINQYGGLLCDMECMIIGSFGDEHPPGVRAIPKEPLKPGDSYLPGFRQDLETIQSMIRKHPFKTLSYIYLDFPSEEYQRPKQEYLQKIKEFLQGCKTPGAMIWYTGHGEEGTGNWCFKDGVITFEEVFALYKEHFRSKLLCLICDCCFSGHWIRRCGETLDAMNVGACGHQARQNGILIKIGTSCLPDQTACDTCYSSNGVTLTSKGRLSFIIGKEIGPTQTALFMDFTKPRCFNKTEDPCRLGHIPSTIRWNWKQLSIKDKRDRLNDCLLIVRGKDRGRQAWHFVIVFEHQLEEFWAAVRTGNVDVTKYGHCIFSGWGEGPSPETKKLWVIYGPTL